MELVPLDQHGAGMPRGNRRPQRNSAVFTVAFAELDGVSKYGAQLRPAGHFFELQLNLVRHPQIVSVEKGEETARRVRCTQIPRGGLSRGSLIKVGQVIVPFDDFSGSIGRSIVDDNQLGYRNGLPSNAGYGFCNKPFAISNGDDR